jgi:hypothetical protein
MHLYKGYVQIWGNCIYVCYFKKNYFILGNFSEDSDMNCKCVKSYSKIVGKMRFMFVRHL